MALWGSVGGEERKHGGGIKLAELVSSLPKEADAMEREDMDGDEEEEGEGESEEDDELLEKSSALEGDEDGDDTKVLFKAQALSDFVAEEEADLSFKEREILSILESSRDDGWMLAENALGERGLIPGNYVQQLVEPSRAASPSNGTRLSPRRGRDLWAKLKVQVNKTSLAEVLSALGAVPTGFRDSTLTRLLDDSNAYRTSTWLYPSLSPTGLVFKDLHWDHGKNELKGKTVKVTRVFSLLAARKIPLPGRGVQVLSRHVRITVFNKQDILSNVHTIRAVWSPQDEKTWKFAPKSQTGSNSASSNSLYHRTCVVKINSNDPNIELLFELGITFKRQGSGEMGELSCGWCVLPLFDAIGNPVANRTLELKVHGGTPFESGVEVDSAANLKASGGFFPSVLRSRQTPKLFIQLSNLNRPTKTSCSLLPSTIVTSSLYVKAIGYFHQLVGSAFLKGRFGQPLPNHVSSPSLNTFLRAIDQPDLMDLTLDILKERTRTSKRADKLSLTFMSENLEAVLLRWTYPLLHSPSLPNSKWADEKTEKERLKYISQFSGTLTLPLPVLDGKEVVHSAMQTSEQFFLLHPSTIIAP